MPANPFNIPKRKELTTKIVSNARNSKYDEPIGPQPAPTLNAYPTTTSSSGSSGSSVSYNLKSYLGDMVNAYNQGANANKALAQQTYDTTIRNLNTALERAQQSHDLGAANAREQYNTTASNLLTSIERFRKQNAQNVENQRKSYLTDQAALESARLEADRQSRIDAAARGLGGSGLQQLAQLQNLINQGQDISELATSNQSTVDKLRTELVEAEEDYNTDLTNAQRTRDNALQNLATILNNAKADNTTGLQDALTTYNNAINSINADLANKIANANYNYGTFSASRSGSGSASDDYVSIINGGLLTIQDNFIDDVKNIMGGSTKANNSQTKKLKSLYESASKQARQYNTDYGSNLAGSSVNTNINNLKSILKGYGVNI